MFKVTSSNFAAVITDLNGVSGRAGHMTRSHDASYREKTPVIHKEQKILINSNNEEEES